VSSRIEVHRPDERGPVTRWRVPSSDCNPEVARTYDLASVGPLSPDVSVHASDLLSDPDRSPTAEEVLDERAATRALRTACPANAIQSSLTVITLIARCSSPIAPPQH
jgi:hypothetical protein